MNAEILARCQFALTVGFHYLFPPISIGLGAYMVGVEWAYLRTKNPFYLNMAKYWTRIFGLVFAVGVATGLVQSLEFGTNWAGFSRYVGDVFGSALGAEGIFAFMLEAGFLAVLLFGWDRVGPKTHFFATLMVALGAAFSAVWIVVANSWMQTPAGFTIVGEGLHAHAEITGFWEMVFNPSAMDRLVHVLIGCFLTGAFLVISISAYYILKNRHIEFARASLKGGLIMAMIFVVAQLISADSSARVVTRYQPAKLAAMEGLFQTQSFAPMYLFGWVDAEKQKVTGVAIPGLLSLLSKRDPAATVTGLDAFPKRDWPKTVAIFQLYRVMIYMWGAMVFTALMGWIFWKRIRQGRARLLLWLMVFSVGFPQLANQAGWFTAEMGRQPWVVYNQLRTSEAVSRVVSAGNVLGSIIMFAVIYLLLFCLFIFLLDRKIKHGPDELESTDVATAA